MVNEKLARRYATAVFSLARERSVVDRVGDDLAAIAAAMQANAAAWEFFVAPVIDRLAKERALLQIFEGRVDELSLHSLLLLVRKRRESLLGGLAAEYRKLQRAARGAATLTVTTARAIPPEELRAMVERLERLYARTFDVTQVVEPDLIGGVRILMGDRRVDGTVSGRLEALARTLFAQN
jgi:F-type H+-transporting ATPase subunit delta